MFLATLVLATSSFPSRPQEKPVPPPVPAEASVLQDVDGHDLVPGAVPASTTAAARERWKKVLAASGQQPAPVTAFDLAIDVRYQATTGQSNDMPAFRYQWLAPRFVRADTGRSRAHLRGPSGSYLIDSSNSDRVEIIKLDVGRENAQDRRQLDEEAGIAANFARLSDPNSIRIRRLTELAGPPAFLPQALQKDAKALAWLELESPDFFVMRPASSKAAALARVALGVNVVDQRVQQVVVDDAAAPAAIGASTAVLKLANYKPVDGFQVPYTIFVWLPEVQDPNGPPVPARWMPKETMSMYVLKASLRAPLTPADFLPPAPPQPR
jgi:hypothetical protein